MIVACAGIRALYLCALYVHTCASAEFRFRIPSHLLYYHSESVPFYIYPC